MGQTSRQRARVQLIELDQLEKIVKLCCALVESIEPTVASLIEYRLDLSVKDLVAVLVSQNVGPRIAFALSNQEDSVDRTMIPDNGSRDLPLEATMKPRLENVNTTIETMEPDHRTTRWCTRKRPPSSSPDYTFALGYVLCFFWIFYYPSDATGKVHRNTGSYRFVGDVVTAVLFLWATTGRLFALLIFECSVVLPELFAVLCEPHGCKPTSPCLFAVEGDDLEPVLPTLRVFGLSVASWPQTGAPLEGRVKTPPCVWNSVYVIVRQMSEGV